MRNNNFLTAHTELPGKRKISFWLTFITSLSLGSINCCENIAQAAINAQSIKSVIKWGKKVLSKPESRKSIKNLNNLNLIDVYGNITKKDGKDKNKK